MCPPFPKLYAQRWILYTHLFCMGITTNDESVEPWEPEVSIGLDWIRTIANFIEFGLDPDCKSPQNLGSGPDLD